MRTRTNRHDPMRSACGYCGAKRGKPCTFVLLPELRVSQSWHHRSRETSEKER